MKLLITVKVQPRSSRPGVEKVGDQEYKVRVSAPPEAGRANAEVMELLSRYFSIPRSQVRIIRGETSRKKLIAVDSDR